LWKKTLNAKELFALDREPHTVYGSLTREALDQFQDVHVKRHLQTDIYATFIESNSDGTLKVEPYNLTVSFA
jgi:hypothetical protein